MNDFASSANAFFNHHASASDRRGAWATFEGTGLPTTSDEVWRYAPLADLSLDRYPVSLAPSSLTPSAHARELCSDAALVVTVVDGHVVSTSGDLAGVAIESLDELTALGGTPLVERYASDAFAILNAALAPSTLRIHVGDGVVLDRPIVVVNVTGARSSFSRLQVVLGRGASATVVDYLEGGEDALVVPLNEYEVGENAALALVTYQQLALSAWHVGRSTAFIGRDARVRQSVVGLGARYNRSRNDSALRATGAENELRTTFFGSGAQVHDYRTRQFHEAGRSHSTLLSKGAVADTARSVYTGLIEIEKGAKRTDARQTNHNLLLSPAAHADSVPNLDIRENDVVCAHASSVGPLDELQRWYLESRGVSRHDAERLMIQGFFNEMLESLPTSLTTLVEREVTRRLAASAVVAP